MNGLSLARWGKFLACATGMKKLANCHTRQVKVNLLEENKGSTLVPKNDSLDNSPIS